jgi:ribonuclease BN (tRNA processing enzyme)
VQQDSVSPAAGFGSSQNVLSQILFPEGGFLKVKILGCFGGNAPGMRPTCFLIDDRIAIDTGALTSVLPVHDQARISHVFITHSHFDHLATLPFLADNVFSLVDKPIEVFGPGDAVRCMKDHIFNDNLWPDFSRLSNERCPIIAIKPLPPGGTVRIGDLSVTAFAMDHSVECHGYLLQGPRSALAICGDTCSAKILEEILPAAREVKAVFLEASFPESARKTALLSRHLSTGTFAREAARIPEEVRIFVTHMKPEFSDRIGREIEALGKNNVSLLEQDREYLF